MRVFRVFRSRSLAMLLVLATFSFTMGSFSTANAVTRRTVYDFTGGIHTDFVTLSAASATAPLRWKVLRNPAPAGPNNAFIRIFDFGIGSDSIVPADRAGDAKFEPCVWRTGNYFCANFPEGPGPLVSLPVVNWGQTGDAVARDGDYDGGGKDDYNVIRTIGGVFNNFYKSAENSPAGDRNVQFGNTTTAGQSLFRFQGADFGGPGEREEIIIARVNTTTFDVTWQIGDSLTGNVITTIQWGNFNTDFIIQPRLDLHQRAPACRGPSRRLRRLLPPARYGHRGVRRLLTSDRSREWILIWVRTCRD